MNDDTAAGFDLSFCENIKGYCYKYNWTSNIIYNLSISESTFLDKLKLAIIKPLYKNGDSTNINNYRPILMISNCAKILEKIIKYRLVEFLEKNNLLSKNQFGFRPRLGTENALYTMLVNSCMMRLTSTIKQWQYF